MSVTFLTHHNENIYNITKEPAGEPIKPELYTSKSKNKIKAERVFDIRSEKTKPNRKILVMGSKLSAHKTMGYIETPRPDPSQFLRKNHGIRFTRITSHKCEKMSHTSSPKLEINNITRMPSKIKKNFQNINIQNCSKISKKPFSMKAVINAKGDTVHLCNAGLIPFYIFSPNFGKIPRYIKDRQKNVEDLSVTQMKNKNTSIFSKHVNMIENKTRSEIIAVRKFIYVCNFYLGIESVCKK
ncbi:uncharacterized protein LOC129614748 [Condylostylus longicornis]|uniref:uncharacterized protein LOC129614748 n=1 Tax=Condylostylus longicornis TaxID=2530218 RepID=UPI00244E262E|nr:uncharacterized protein LOC129614748 [Condylostylus longicornis]